MWPEVSLDDWHWLPVEPTPGYPVPCNAQTLGQRLYAVVCWIGTQVAKRPIASTIGAGLVIASVFFRRSIVAAVAWLLWGVMLTFFQRYRLGLTRRLLDLRFWAADLPRPQFETPSNWYSQVDEGVADRFIHFWRSKQFSSAFDSNSSPNEVYAACKEVVQELTVNRIRNFAAQCQPKNEQ